MSFQEECPRRLFHLSGLLLLLVPALFPGQEKMVFLALALGESVFEFLRLYHPYFRRLCLRLFSSLLRDEEKRHLSGSFFYLWGVALSFLFFEVHCATYGLLVLAVVDPVAGILHVRSQKRLGRKSALGTLVFFGLCFGLLLAGGWGAWKAFGTALLAAGVENLSPLNDNLLLPLTVSLILCLV